MQLYLIRHTKVAVPQDIFYGQTDVSLADSFINEANIIKNKLKYIVPDIVFSSPLTRCKLLAKEITQNDEIIFDERLKEINFGNWEMKNWKEIKVINVDNWYKNFVDTRCENGESYFDLYERVKIFFEELKIKNHKTIFIFTHGGTIRAFISLIKEIDLKKSMEEKIDYGSISKFEI